MATPIVAPAIDPTAHNIDDSVDPNNILNPSFIDLFLEEAPPQWTLADLQQLHVIRGQPANVVAPFQKLPVELVEHIAHNLSAFRDIKALGSSCTFFRKILFESSNHLFWYKWSKAPHSLCRWDLGYYRQNRAYQNTIVNQQNGRRRKRCETCMARAVSGLAFKKKTCTDCWEDLGVQANELFFVHNIDISAVPHEYVDASYAPRVAGMLARSEWDLLYFYKPGHLEKQLLATNVQVARESRPDKLIQFAQQNIRNMTGEILQIKRSMGYRPSLYSYYNSGPNIRREKWYAENIANLVCPAEVIQRMLEVLICQDVGEEWLDRGPYERMRPAEELYGPTTPIATGFKKVDCELQLEEEWKREFGEDLSNLHDCKIECHRKKRAEQFTKLWWPQAEKSFVEMLVGPKAIVLTDEEIGKLRTSSYSWQWRDNIQKITLGILSGCKWVVPGIRGEWTAETVAKWETVNGTEGSEAPGNY
ncbi:hypothetical protein TWF730_000224 [Orbilia blumenaviensis]|uniref:F-box domain-containing protein n=1 Tax=Orbilia blumenaviensis TaxID=1796055 RepID=A0AAV9VKW2_9PEZI